MEAIQINRKVYLCFYITWKIKAMKAILNWDLYIITSNLGTYSTARAQHKAYF